MEGMFMKDSEIEAAFDLAADDFLKFEEFVLGLPKLDLVRWILKLLAVPAVLQNNFAARNLRAESLLRDLWTAVACRHQVDDEGSFTNWESDEFLKYQIENEPEKSELAKFFINMTTWRKIAEEEYRYEVRKITFLKMATSEDYSKHYVLPNQTKNQVANLSRTSGVSKFYSHITPTKLEVFMFDVLAEFFEDKFRQAGEPDAVHDADAWRTEWKRHADSSALLIYVDCMEEVGASGGQPTEHLCLNVNFSTPIAHAYPVNKNEIGPSDHRLAVDSLQ